MNTMPISYNERIKLLGCDVIVMSEIDLFLPRVEALEDTDNLAYIAWWEKYGKTIQHT
jgi:hypothetical protein